MRSRIGCRSCEVCPLKAGPTAAARTRRAEACVRVRFFFASALTYAAPEADCSPVAASITQMQKRSVPVRFTLLWERIVELTRPAGCGLCGVSAANVPAGVAGHLLLLGTGSVLPKSMKPPVMYASSGPGRVTFTRTVKCLPYATWLGAVIETLLAGCSACAAALAGHSAASAPIETKRTVRIRSR